MNIFLIISLLILILGIFLFIKERRSFLTGITLVLGVLFLILYIMIVLGSNNESINLILMLIIYGGIPIAILLSGFFLIKNGEVMKKKEGNNLANKLSLFLGVNILIIISLSLFLIFSPPDLNYFVYMTVLSIILLQFYFGFLFMSYLAYSYIYQKMPLKKRVNYIIILGSGLIGDRVPPLLKSRLDKGLEIYKEQIHRGNNTKLIVSGGQGSDELVSEAYAMKKYLLSHNVKDSDVIMEDKSTTTYENMKFSKKIMDSMKRKYSCVFVTNNYHVFRASIFARKANLKANGLGSPTSFYFLPSALIREFIAILVLHKWFHIIIILLFFIFVIISSLPY